MPDMSLNRDEAEQTCKCGHKRWNHYSRGFADQRDEVKAGMRTKYDCAYLQCDCEEFRIEVQPPHEDTKP